MSVFGILKFLVPAIGILAVAGTIYFQRAEIKTVRAERDLHKERAVQFKDALEAYRQNFQDQVNTLDQERRAEIKRQEHMLRTLNLIGDLNEIENRPIPDAAVDHIDRLYGTTR